MTVASEPVVDVRDLTFTYTDAEQPALRAVNLEVHRGEVVLLVGLTAAGKSTLYLALSGLIPHVVNGDMTGSVIVEGYDTEETPLATMSQHVGIVMQDPGIQLFALSVEDELAFGPENLGVPADEIRRRVDEAVRVVKLEDILQAEPAKLSGGQQQAVAVGSVWAMLPGVLILDEPTSNLDPVGSVRVLELVRELSDRWNKTILIAEHKIDYVAPMADRVIVMEAGSVVRQGTPREVFGDPTLRAELGLRPPASSQLTELLSDITGRDLTVALDVEEAAAQLDELLEHEGSRGLHS